MIVALAGQKGGAGKSTVVVSLAAEGVARGLKVLVVDADPQATARTWVSVANRHGHPIPTIMAMGGEMHRPDQLPRIAPTFDLVLIDCPPRTDEAHRAALLVADLAILPCGPSAFEAWALTSSFDLVKDAQRLGAKLEARVLLTRKQKATALGQSARDVLTEGGFPVLRTELGYRVAYQEATIAGQAVSTYAPRSEAAGEVRALLDEVLALGAPAPAATPVRAPAATATTKAKPKGKAVAKRKGS